MWPAPAIVYLDALFPKLDPEPDFSDDPVWSIPDPDPAAEDLASCEAYLAYIERVRPDLARIWCPAIEAEVLDKVAILDDCRIEDRHDDKLMNRIASENWPSRNPQYGRVEAPQLAIVPDGDYHHGLSPDAPDKERMAADRYWSKKVLPWIRQRTEIFRQAAPTAHVVELDAPNHLIFIAREDETLKAIYDFLLP